MTELVCAISTGQGGGQPVTRSDNSQAAKLMARIVADGIKEHVFPRIARLETRVQEAEAKPTLHDAGVWREGKSYGVGAVVTDHGSAWCAQRPTMARPGSGDDWRLFVKRGRDGRR